MNLAIVCGAIVFEVCKLMVMLNSAVTAVNILVWLPCLVMVTTVMEVVTTSVPVLSLVTLIHLGTLSVMLAANSQSVVFLFS